MHWTVCWRWFSSFFNLRISIAKDVGSMPFIKQSKSAQKYLQWVWRRKGIGYCILLNLFFHFFNFITVRLPLQLHKKNKEAISNLSFLWMVANTLFFVFRVNLSGKYKQILTPTYRPVALMDSYKIITNRLPFMWEAIKSPLWDS